MSKLQKRSFKLERLVKIAVASAKVRMMLAHPPFIYGDSANSPHHP
jgi:hypothetical protein